MKRVLALFLILAFGSLIIVGPSFAVETKTVKKKIAPITTFKKTPSKVTTKSKPIQPKSQKSSQKKNTNIKKTGHLIKPLPKSTLPSIKDSNKNVASSKRFPLSNSEIISTVKPATVFIQTNSGSGTGMLIDGVGYILTNAHVVWDAPSAAVKLNGGQIFSAEVVGRDEIIDLALLRIIGNNFPRITFGNSDDILPGEDVFTLGYPFGLEGDVSFKEGTISRRISGGNKTYLETSAEIHPGNSGGPLLNKYGEVIGVNTAALGQLVKGIAVGETIKLAIPINVAKQLIPALRSGRNIIVPRDKVTPDSKTEKVNTAPEVRIELCRVKAKQEGDSYRNELYDAIKKDHPKVLALAEASNRLETENAAIKYGYISQSDVVRSADVFKKLVAEGYPIETAKIVADAEGAKYWTYLQSLHDWGEKELNRMRDIIESGADKWQTKIYDECLNSL